MVHNMFYNTSSKLKWPYHTTGHREMVGQRQLAHLDVTAQRQVMLHHAHLDRRRRWEGDLAEQAVSMA